MPKKARTAVEVGAYKKHILDTAVKLIVKDGYDNFSMRKLAAKLGVSATSIYDYYANKETLYLNVLIEGFNELTSLLLAAGKNASTNEEKASNVVRAYIDFGIKKANLYNIMLIWNVPKYYDFVGKPAEALAKRELECAMAVRKVSADAIAGCDYVFGRDDKADDAMLNIMCAIHGFISFYNSQALDYLASGLADGGDLIENFIATLFDGEFFNK